MPVSGGFVYGFCYDGLVLAQTVSFALHDRLRAHQLGALRASADTSHGAASLAGYPLCHRQPHREGLSLDARRVRGLALYNMTRATWLAFHKHTPLSILSQDTADGRHRAPMSKARLVITAAAVEGRPVAQVARDDDVARSWVYELLARNPTAFEPRSRRPKTSPQATPPAVVEQVLALRAHLTEQGLDASADTICWHLAHHHGTTVSRATIHRILVRAGTKDYQPTGRPPGPAPGRRKAGPTKS